MGALNIQNPAIPFGSHVVVSGVSRFVGSHVADQALAAGYKVRGTTCKIHKSAWIKEQFEKEYGPGNFELAEVLDMAADGAFVEAVNVNGALNALRASAKEQSMKCFMYTSSSYAATLPKPGGRFTITAETFSEVAIKQARGPDADRDSVYTVSKVEAERAIANHQGYPMTVRWAKSLWESDFNSLKHVPPQHFINMQDDVRLHIIRLGDPSVQGERIFAIKGPFSLNNIIGVLRKLYPGRRWEDYPGDARDLSTFEIIKRAEELLLQSYGKGFVGLKEIVGGNVADLAT
ncbi:hypothetical protein BJX70DRAFT_402791 [Aspergillus crustosus]